MMRWALLAAVFAACEAPDLAPPASLWTLREIGDAFDRGATIAPGATAAFPDGLPARLFVDRGAGGPEMTVTLATTEGAPAAYVSTEVWANYPAVWVQPAYRLVTDDPAGPALPGALPIFSVGPGAPFYSPFWRLYDVVVPRETPPDRYRSVRSIFDDGLPLREAEGRLMALVPRGTAVQPPAASPAGRIGLAAGTPDRTEGIVDGRDEPVTVLDFGPGRFRWNDRLEVIEQPLFVFLGRRPDGSWAPANVPSVGGTGPLFTRTPAIAPGNRPAFGSLWRLHTVRLPPSTDEGLALFVPPGAPFTGAAADLVRAVQGVEVPAVTWSFPDPAEGGKHALMLATNGRTCFKDAASFASCRWVDSQAAVEESFPEAITATDIRVTCPFVSYAGRAVPTP